MVLLQTRAWHCCNGRGGAEVDTARDKEVEGRDGEAATDVTLNADVTDLAWKDNDLYLEIDYESSGVHKMPVATSTPLSIPTEDTVLPPPSASKYQKTLQRDSGHRV